VGAFAMIAGRRFDDLDGACMTAQAQW